MDTENLQLHENDFFGPLPNLIKSLKNLSTYFQKVFGLSLYFNKVWYYTHPCVILLSGCRVYRVVANWSSGTHCRVCAPVAESWYVSSHVYIILIKSIGTRSRSPHSCITSCMAEMLVIAENFNINGTIPSEIGTLTNIRELVLQRTHVSGIVPSEVGLLSNLGK